MHDSDSGKPCASGGGAFRSGGRGGPGRRYFGRGSVKFALLELLSGGPMHGYQMMKALEERSDGHYTPSAGSIYPTLAMLEDRGWIVSEEADGKKIYRPTAEGEAALHDWRQRDDRPREDADSAPPRERRLADGFELIRLMTKAEKRAAVHPDSAARYQRFLDGAIRELRAMLAEARAEGRRDAEDGGRDARSGPVL
ncbi:PadR family transcriptional regulator [Paenibacillus flagellatus]|uniref:PadR family transcriptional regulator n=1 Tax=Paenibacillus flagellatus TaxID=2211139 RepID=A0A2V5K0B3_9BACL|nr:PadR family transcriptional regulator [Paenibacillus flagellatus]PYI52521.1 PadR family transcriptional regulator [Paenibacillus flagellatus]